ncbi:MULTISPECIES: 2-oxo acid dehydrogenase subunit E2 [unclassified Acinetobacter]|uniref:2-oxo acid dehydrogenase subunit E2 n=1 Tax=unclassified Acinetobacter TaxID=196816 RepID=UPI00190CE002|nr:MULTISPECIES: 2-oxo acid dehydrogenase subunit E2 [unclassified Acinetobacter]MBK0063511.1 2-oxo acid dehydrogenase subunit E2 [Acinetobacter sp. S55]MBK0065418.1 2-oxo acid dehydrogenase subunit E2 [Acinetobacter sp. S54]
MQVKTPDIGVEKATVAEILVKVGDQISENDSLILLESDKASVEVPSTASGVVKSILVNQGDEVTEGTVLVELESGSEAATEEKAAVKSEEVSEATSSEATKKPATRPTISASSGATTIVEVQVPDIGVEKATVAELLVKVGDEITENDSLILLESDKASVEVPSPVSGTVESVAVKEGDSVKEGVLLLKVKTQGGREQVTTANENTVAQSVETASTTVEDETDTQETVSSGEQEINVPDLGVDKATVSEILVQVGDRVEAQQSLCVVESDKASVEVPSSIAGVVKAIHVSVGQEVKQGIALATIEGEAKAAPKAKLQASKPAAQTASVKTESAAKPAEQPKAAVVDSVNKLSQAQEAENAKVYAGPAVRKLARELGVILAQVKASGEHGRLMKEDIYAHVKQRMTAPAPTPANAAAAVASGLPALPDFSAFGGGEVKTMTRLQQVSVPQLSLNNFIPQVTQFDLADITELEAWRGELKDGFKKQGVSLTILAFIAKAVAHLLKEEPYFAGHLADDQKSVLLRNEIHMGIAVATPDGLTVPVLRNPDQKSIKQIAVELGELSQKARDKKLSPKDLQGANFTITSLGSIGGTAFTPLVNWPQVAILGISPATMQPVWNGKDFDPRLMLPLSLSYDHRVINGADAARFTNKLTKLLKDIRTLLI